MNKQDWALLKQQFEESYGQPLPEVAIKRASRPIIHWGKVRTPAVFIKQYLDSSTVCYFKLSKILISLFNDREFQHHFFGVKNFHLIELGLTHVLINLGDYEEPVQAAYIEDFKFEWDRNKIFTFEIPLEEHVASLTVRKEDFFREDIQVIPVYYLDTYPEGFIRSTRDQVLPKFIAWFNRFLGKTHAFDLRIAESSPFYWENKCQACCLFMTLSIWRGFAKHDAVTAIKFPVRNIKFVRAFFKQAFIAMQKRSELILVNKTIRSKKLFPLKDKKQPESMTVFTNRALFMKRVVPELVKAYNRAKVHFENNPEMARKRTEKKLKAAAREQERKEKAEQKAAKGTSNSTKAKTQRKNSNKKQGTKRIKTN